MSVNDTSQAPEVGLAQTERLLALHTHMPIGLTNPTVVSRRQRSLVIRCTVTGWSERSSVIIKYNLGDDARGFTDWASLEFLSGVHDAVGFAPRFIVADVERRVFIMEDLGGSRTLADELEHGSRASVLRSLRMMGHTMGRLVASTADREGSFDEMRSGLPGTESVGRRQEVERWIAGFDRLQLWSQALGLPIPGGFRAAFDRVAEVYARPGPCLAFSHGDPAPTNNHLSSAGMTLLDFEYAGYRHALYDVTAWDILCPLPPNWVNAVRRSFCRTIIPGPARSLLESPARLEEAWATMCAFRALAMLTWLSPEIIQTDREWSHGWTRRQATISTVVRLSAATAAVPSLQPLRAFGDACAQALRRLWPDIADGAIDWPAARR